jgi:hypothetical protein
VVTAIGRELLGFIWAIGIKVEATQKDSLELAASKPANFNLCIDRLLSLVALYCWSSDSQHNPRSRIGVGHSILTNVKQDLAG